MQHAARYVLASIDGASGGTMCRWGTTDHLLFIQDANAGAGTHPDVEPSSDGFLGVHLDSLHRVLIIR